MPQHTTSPFGLMVPAMITPFDKSGEVDFERMAQLADRLIDGGSDSLLVCGTTGESPTIPTDVKLKLFETVIEASGGRVPVIGNVGGNCTSDSVDFARKAKAVGVDGVMAVVPYYNKPPQEGMYQHFKAIAEAAEVPMIVYNIPGRCAVNMLPETTLRLARDVENIIVVKEASGDINQMTQIIEGAPDGFWVYAGDDSFTCELVKRGGGGVISTIGNIVPGPMREIAELAMKGDHDAAFAAHEKLLPLMKQLFVTTNPILVKEALKLSGFDVGGVRLPLVDATEEQSADLARVMREVGVLD